MSEGTPFVRPGNERVREMVRQRITDGRWRVDADTGTVFGERGQPLRGKRNTSGYVQYSFRDTDDYNVCVGVSGHIVIWEYVHDRIPWPLQVNHINGIKDDNRLANLELLPPVENLRHAHRTGLMKYQRAPGAKLDPSKVRHIRRLLAEGYPMRVSAEMYGVSIPVIRDIKWNRIWRWVD